MKRNQKGTSLIKFIVLVMITVLVLVGCSGGNSSNNKDTEAKTGGASGGKVTLTFWNGFTAADGEVLKEIVNRYNEENKDKVEIKMDILPWTELYTKLPPAIATNTAPSFILTSPAQAAAYIKNGSLQDMDDFFSASGADKADFSESALKLGQVDGKQYTIPMQVFGLFLYWNKDLFKAAGLDPEKPPQTMEEMAEYAVKLTDAGKNQFGLGLPTADAAPYYSYYLRANGGDAVDLANKKSVLDSPENLKTLQWLQDLALNKKVTPQGGTGPDVDKLMQSGKLGLYVNGPWLIPGMKNNGINFGVALPPKGSVKQTTLLDGNMFAIPKGTSEEEKKAIYDFVKYWTSTAIVKEWSTRNGFPPFLKSVAEDTEVKSDPILSVMSQVGDIAEPWLPNVIGGARIDSDVMFPLLESVFFGGNAEEELKKASGQTDEILKSE
jgi:multiple sugar transport system substrate-binding protein